MALVEKFYGYAPGDTRGVKARFGPFDTHQEALDAIEATIRSFSEGSFQANCWGRVEKFYALAPEPPSQEPRRCNQGAICDEDHDEPDLRPFKMPDRIGIDAKGFGWRAWDDEDYYSMVPQNPDNSPIPEPITWFVRADIETERADGSFPEPTTAHNFDALNQRDCPACVEAASVPVTTEGEKQ